MSAKSVLNELFQALRGATPVYATRLDVASGAPPQQQQQQPQEQFLCELKLPEVDNGHKAMREERAFSGRGSTKKVRARTGRAARSALLSLRFSSASFASLRRSPLPRSFLKRRPLPHPSPHTTNDHRRLSTPPRRRPSTGYAPRACSPSSRAPRRRETELARETLLLLLIHRPSRSSGASGPSRTRP